MVQGSLDRLRLQPSTVDVEQMDAATVLFLLLGSILFGFDGLVG